MKKIEKETPMNNLLLKSPVLPKINQIVSGTVIEIGKNTIFIDLGAFGTGVILGREIKENQQIIKANKGGLIVELKGVQGFLPVSQLSYEHYPRVEDADKMKILSELNKFVGKELAVRIIDLSPEKQKFIVPEKAL